MPAYTDDRGGAPLHVTRSAGRSTQQIFHMRKYSHSIGFCFALDATHSTHGRLAMAPSIKTRSPSLPAGTGGEAVACSLSLMLTPPTTNECRTIADGSQDAVPLCERCLVLAFRVRPRRLCSRQAKRMRRQLIGSRQEHHRWHMLRYGRLENVLDCPGAELETLSPLVFFVATCRGLIVSASSEHRL